jgi:YesN/AraC family two-component response regulator
MVGHFNDLLELEYSPKAGARWKQQLIFQQMILDMHATTGLGTDSNMQEIAERAATYIRKNYRNTITYDHIREALNFHPTYTSRCMKQIYGSTLNDYLIRYRIEQASLLLLTTNLPIHEVAEKAGFQNLSYFARKFFQEKEVQPRQYRHSYAK